MLRDLGSRNHTWFFIEQPHRLIKSRQSLGSGKSLQPPVAHHRPLHHVPVAAQSLAGLDATPGDPGQAWHQDEIYIPTRDRSLCGAWIALALTRDPLHPHAREQWQALHAAGARINTSLPVVIETFTFLERFGLTSLDDLPPLSTEAAAATAAATLVDGAPEAGPIAPDRGEAADAG